MTSHEPFAVTIVQNDRGSHVEPELDQSWSDLEKLQWHAGVLEARTGIRVSIVTDVLVINGRGRRDYYGWSMVGSGGGAMPYHEMWTFLNGVELGARTAKP